MASVKVQTFIDNLTKKDPEWTKRGGSKHLYKVINGKTYRLKVQEHTIRYEVQVTYEKTTYSPEKKDWVRIKTLRPK